MKVKMELKPYRVTLHCNECGGKMKQTGIVLYSHPPQYPHLCENEHKAIMEKAYPCIEHEELSPEDQDISELKQLFKELCKEVNGKGDFVMKLTADLYKRIQRL